MKTTLFLLLGYPGSGKSTFSQELEAARDLTRVNSDDLRRYMFEHIEQIHDPANNPAVFGALDYVTERLLQAGRSVLYDANNNRRAERSKHQKIAELAGARMVVLWVRSPLETAWLRNQQRTPENGYPAIPRKRYDQIVHALEVPTDNEKAVIISGLEPFEVQLASFDVQLEAVERTNG
ncbi:MAG TPA: ATP-binding protein [Candidatus Saccharimonadales bacterium]|nr:ATP-binding protein [Candidatus Saccharimonadales bacterium]